MNKAENKLLSLRLFGHQRLVDMWYHTCRITGQNNEPFMVKVIIGANTLLTRLALVHWSHTSSSNSCFDQGIQFFITSNGKLQVARGDSLHFQVFGTVSCQFQHLISGFKMYTYTSLQRKKTPKLSTSTKPTNFSGEIL